MEDPDLISAVMKLVSEITLMRGDVGVLFQQMKDLTLRHDELITLWRENSDAYDRRLRALEHRRTNGQAEAF